MVRPFDELRALIRKTFGLQEVLADALHPLENKVHIAFVYSSFATGAETGDSDVDVMIVGDGLTLDEVVAGLSPIQAEISREINPSLYSAAEFRRRVATGHHSCRPSCGNRRSTWPEVKMSLKD